MRPVRLITVLAAIAVLSVVATFLLLQQDPSPSPPPLPDSAPAPAEAGRGASEPERNLAAVPGTVRILARPLDPTADEQRDTLLAEVEHLGPLEGADRENFLAALEQRYRDRQRKLAQGSADARDSAALLEEADLLLEEATAKAAMRAIELGSYVTTRIGAKTPPLTLPEAEVLRGGAMRDGQPVNVTIVMPWREYPEVAQARRYFDDMLAFDDSERARKFNALPDAERFRLAKEIWRILRKPDPTQDENNFVRKWIGFGNRLSESQALVLVPPR